MEYLSFLLINLTLKCEGISEFFAHKFTSFNVGLHRVLKAQSDHRSRHEGENFHRKDKETSPSLTSERIT